MKKSIPITNVLDLHQFSPRDIKIVVEEYLYQCAEKGFRFVRIIHGKGIGVQRELVRSILKTSEFVESFEEGPDWGSTSVLLTARPQRHAKVKNESDPGLGGCL